MANKKTFLSPGVISRLPFNIVFLTLPYIQVTEGDV